ncbi:hypothetical protein CRUP_036003 [Coryphaenoides rupestris]|nr:hypothetical protein CRUP_036003 [Coryphaenoides rupestris]
MSMTDVLPWTYCSNPWNTPACVGVMDAANRTLANATAVAAQGVVAAVNRTKRTSPSEEYWNEPVTLHHSWLFVGRTEHRQVAWSSYGGPVMCRANATISMAVP